MFAVATTCAGESTVAPSAGVETQTEPAEVVPGFGAGVGAGAGNGAVPLVGPCAIATVTVGQEAALVPDPEEPDPDEPEPLEPDPEDPEPEDPDPVEPEPVVPVPEPVEPVDPDDAVVELLELVLPPQPESAAITKIIVTNRVENMSKRLGE